VVLVTEAEIKAWLLAYAWMGDGKDAARVDCIMAQDGWKYIDVVADAFAGAQETGGGPEEFAAGNEFALSALYECHDGPHLDTCPTS
jgi:hypothetical protein